MKTKLSGVTQSNEDVVLGDLLIEISSQEIFPIVRRLLEKKGTIDQRSTSRLGKCFKNSILAIIFILLTNLSDRINPKGN